MTTNTHSILNPQSEGFRRLDEMTNPDARSQCVAVLEQETGAARNWTLSEHYAVVESFAVGDAVPNDIRVQWETARNLWLYAWHVWRFFPVAEQHAYATLEFALRLRLGHETDERPPTLRALLDEALAKSLIQDSPLEYLAALDGSVTGVRTGAISDPQSFCKILSKAIPKLRNHHAHGCSSISWTISPIFGICRDLINQLFPS